MISYIDNKLKLSAAFLVAGLILSGCGSSADSSVGSDSLPKVNKTKSSLNKKSYTAEAGLTVGQRFSKAIENLNNGEDGQALAEPSSTIARNLVEQISTDSSQYFPSENFIVNLKAGSTLGSLAKKYLGSALKFYALAKYNNITNPSRVKIGQEIKIPLTQLSRAQQDKDNSEELQASQGSSEESVVDGTTTQEINDAMGDVVNDIEVIAEPDETSELMLAAIIPVAPEETAESTLRELQALTQMNDYTTAIEKVITLRTFGKFDKVSRQLAIATYAGRAKEIAETNNILASSYLAQAGQLNLLEQQTFEAFENFKMATDLDDTNEQAMEEMLVLQKEIADKFHRQALSAYRRQELDLAIEKWDMVLNVNPDHSSAKLYRVQALELKEKLDNINQN
jgi:tetratricopeptide (TPR) repeat protein